MNSTVSVIWVDDDFSDPKESLYFESIIAMINEKIRKDIQVSAKNYVDIDIIINKISSPSEAVNEIEKNYKEYSLAIVDYKYTTDANFNDIFRQLNIRNIPFVVFSLFTQEIDCNPAISNSDLLLKCIQKHSGKEEYFVDFVVTFCLSKPISLIHISDLHYNSHLSLDDPNGKDQFSFFKNLVKEMYNISKLRKIDLVVFTGDMCANNPKNDFMEILEHFKELSMLLFNSSSSKNILMVPGNHDVLWENFKKKKISKQPWQEYLDFYYKFYNDNYEVLSEMQAWDRTKMIFKSNVKSIDLVWRRKFNEFNLNIIGIPSPSTVSGFQGDGCFEGDYSNFIEKTWEKETFNNEIRVAITHHNALSVFSQSSLDQKKVMHNAGDFVQTLMKHNCKLLLSGHTHYSSFIKMDYCNYSEAAKKMRKNILFYSSGPTGGFSKTHQRNRSFSLIDILPDPDNINKKMIKITPYYYYSSDKTWSAATTEDMFSI